VLKEDEERCKRLVELAHAELGFPLSSWPELTEEVRDTFLAIFQQFNLASNRAIPTFDTLDRILVKKGLKA
jgi:hypothetical protein